VPLTLLASGSAVILGAVWGAVPTPFAAELVGTHELGKLGWLLGGQIVALVFGACCVLVARNVVGFPDRLLPPSWQARAFALALSMLVILAGSLVTLGLPFLQAPWWLALSLASYTLAGAMWGFLLPRLRPTVGTVVLAQRHYLCGPDRGLTDPLHLALGRAQEERLARLFATAEGVLIAFMTPVLGADRLLWQRRSRAGPHRIVLSPGSNDACVDRGCAVPEAPSAQAVYSKRLARDRYMLVARRQQPCLAGLVSTQRKGYIRYDACTDDNTDI